MKRLFSILLTLMLLLAIMPTVAPQTHAETESMLIAGWNYGGGEGNSMPANEGEARWSAVVKLGRSNFGTSAGCIKTTSWSHADQYIEFSLCTKGFSNITHSSMTRASATGPKYFKVQYSLDGENFTDCGNFTVSGTDLTMDLDGLVLPEAASNQDLVYVRWVLAQNVNFNGTAVSGSGTFNMKNAQFCGTPIDEELTVEAEPNGGDMALGDKVYLSAGNEGASIFYRSYPPQSDDTPYSVYNAQTGIELTTLPFAIQTYAQAGQNEGRIRLFEYTQYKVKAVNASRYSGAIEAGREITFSSDTVGASIFYDLTTCYGLENEQTQSGLFYSGPLSFDEAEFPVHIVAHATKTGCLDSELLTLDYTLKHIGGEQFYYGQLHTHTNISDGAGTLREAFDYAKNTANNLDYLIVSDHSNYLDNKSTLGTMDGVNRGIELVEKNYAEGDPIYEEGITKWDYAKRLASTYSDENFIGAYGYEMTWSGQYGHINTFATEGFVSRNDPQYVITGGQGLRTYYELLAQYPSSISMFNHPGETFGTFDDYAYYQPEYDAQMYLIEVGNGEGAVGGSTYWPSYEQYNRALDKGWHIAPANSQDNHKGRWGDSNTCRTVIYTNDFTEAGLYAGIRDLRVIATEDDNSSILFKINNELFGSTMDQRPDTLHVSVTITDPDVSDRSGRLSIIANNSTVAYSQSYVLINGSVTLEFDLDPLYDYYFARIDQSDGDICISSPIWIDEVSKVGISSLQADKDILIRNENTGFEFEIYNDESIDFTAESIVVEALGEQIYHSENITIPTGSQVEFNFNYSPSQSGEIELLVSVVGKLEQKDITLTAQQKYAVFEKEDVMVVAIDAAHDNYYVSGNYADYYQKLCNMVQIYNGRTVVITDSISEQSLQGVDLLILSAPYVSTFNNGKQYTASEVEAIKGFTDAGGSLLIAGKSSYGDSNQTYTDTTFNTILEAVGTDTRLRRDNTRDPDNTGSYDYQLNYTTTDAFALDNDIAAGITDASCQFVYHNGSSVAPGKNATAVVFGGENAYGYEGDNTTISGQDTVYLSEETLLGGGRLFVTGCMFFNDYQLSNVASAEGQGANYHLINNILRTCTNVTPISTVREAEAGSYFMVRGTLVSNASEYSADTAFFDSVYIEDETGGICLFPVSGNYHVGQQVWASGFVDNYQGDFELSECKVFIDSNEEKEVKAHISTAAECNAEQNQGMLLSIRGTVTDIKYNGENMEYITVQDETGSTIIFIDGYISTTQRYNHSSIEVGKKILAYGVATTGPVTGVDGFAKRLRVRDIAELALFGDVDYNGEITAADAAFILRRVVRLEEFTALQEDIADINANGSTDAADAASILRFIVRLTDELK